MYPEAQIEEIKGILKNRLGIDVDQEFAKQKRLREQEEKVRAVEERESNLLRAKEKLELCRKAWSRAHSVLDWNYGGVGADGVWRHECKCGKSLEKSLIHHAPNVFSQVFGPDPLAWQFTHDGYCRKCKKKSYYVMCRVNPQKMMQLLTGVEIFNLDWSRDIALLREEGLY